MKTIAAFARVKTGDPFDATRMLKNRIFIPILRQAQDEVVYFQWLEPHGELVEP
jgi:hypothetical protein